jgi:oligopeptide/dipeptide ABC transporter ATP-binding protein
LNPRLTAAGNVAEPLRIEGRLKGAARAARVAELFGQVGLHPGDMSRLPSQLSGGQRQRVCIARALALEPDVIVLDEAVSALDVSVRAQVLNLLRRLQRRTGVSYLFISHDLSVVSHLCDRVAVMYLGRIVETGTREDVFNNPRHPYTRALLSAVPIADPDDRGTHHRILLAGDPPSPVDPPSGCRFRTRCWVAQPSCGDAMPQLKADAAEPTHVAACFFPQLADAPDAVSAPEVAS